jgi:hypothetical protein
MLDIQLVRKLSSAETNLTIAIVDAFSGRTHECAGSRGNQYHLVEVPSMGRSNRLGGRRSNRLG